MKKITPFLWFDKQAREAAEFYISLLPGSRLTGANTVRDTPSGDTGVVSFELAGQSFMAMSAGPMFRFNPAVSFHLKCGTKEEVDAVWAKLSLSGTVLMPLGSYPFSEHYGWIQDKYGLSWQVIQVGANALEQRVTPALLFVGAVCGKTEEAIQMYASVFGGKAEVLARYGSGSAPDKEGTVQYARFVLNGQEFVAMDSAHDHKFAFNEAVSFLVPCETQEEVDYFWEKLAADPNAGQCGWLKDRYGLSWQVVPTALQELMSGPDPQRVQRVTQAMLKMKKLDISALRRAAEG